jgi:glycosyltransferase involved in cell wall biosynthesis
LKSKVDRLGKGVEVDVFTRRLRGEKRDVPSLEEGYKVGRLRVFRLGPMAGMFNWPLRIWWMVWVIVRVLVEQMRRPYDLVHAHANSAILPGKVLSMLLRRPLVITIHGVNVLEMESAVGFSTGSNSKEGGKLSLLARLERWLLTRIPADEVISVQEHFKDFPSVHEKIAVIPNGVDVAEYDQVKVKKSKVFKIVWVGRFDRVKGLEVLLRALGCIKHEVSCIKGGNTGKEYDLHLIGGGGDLGYENEMRNLVKELGLSRVVKFRGVITGKEKIKELKSAHVFVLPSLSEGQPITVLEAWAAGLPVVVTRVGDNPRMVRNGINGWLVEPGGVEGLADALVKAMKVSKKKLEEMGMEGYELVKEKFSWERAAEGVGEVYERVVGA